VTGAQSWDAALLRRAARRIGLQTAVLVWAAFGICALVLFGLVVRSQHQATASSLRTAVERADDVNDPPEGTWLAVQGPSGRVDLSPGAPSFMPYRASTTSTPASGGSSGFDVHTREGEYRVFTEQRNGRLVQAVSSLAADHAERTRLIEGLAVAGGLAVLVAGVLGAVAGRRWVAPLADSLTRQRAFVADASHELRTPLTQLTTRAQLVERSLARGESGRARAETAALIADGRHLTAVLEDLLTAAEPADVSDWESVSLAAAAAQGAAAVRAEAEAAGVTLEVRADDGGGAGAAPVAVSAPRAGLDRAVLALLDNAVRHTPPGGRVEIAVDAGRRWATLAVSDTGSGIPQDEQDRLFDRFAHGAGAHGARRRFGLGLALAADTAQRLGGDISFSTGTAGTTMRMRLPRTER
jgi:two-component system OmpR family sensor kinase